MSRRRVRNALLAFVAIGVLLRVGAQFREIAQGVQRSSTSVPSAASAPTDQHRAQPRAASLQWTGTLAGRVTHAGAPAPDTWVFLEGPSARRARADAAGRFAFANLRPGDYVLFAIQEPWASERLGPLPLAAGEDLRDLALDLQEGLTLEGIVVGLPEQTPIAGAVIRAARQRTDSDDTGHFALVGLPHGRLTALIEAEGYLARRVTIAPPAEHLVLALDRGAKVFGTVVSQGAPVAGAEIFAARYDPGMRREAPLPVATTDRQGRFEGFAPLGAIELLARAGGWAEGRSGTLDLQPGEPREIDFVLGEGGSLQGVVRSAEQAPQNGCRIEARDATQDRPLAFATSGQRGEFWLTALPPSIYSVVAQCPEGRAELSGLRVVDREEARIELVLGSASLAGHVLDVRGVPVAGARIDARPQGSGTRAGPFWKSDATGRFVLTGLTGQRFTVTASAPEGEAELRDVAAGSADLSLVLTSSGIEGTVRGARGERVADFTLAAIPIASARTNDPSDAATPGQPRSQRFVSSEGTFHLPLLPGRYDVKVSAPGQRGTTLQAVEVRPNRLGRLDLRLEQSVELTGEVLSEADGSPIAGAIVASDVSLLMAFTRAAPVTDGAWARTDAEGAFHLTGLAPSGDSLTLFVEKKGFHPKGQSVATSGPRVRLLLTPKTSEEASLPDEIVGIGLSFFLKDERFTVGSVMPFSPAQAAGIQMGDELIRIDGQAVAGQPLAAIANAIRGVIGTTVHLTLRRGEAAVEVAVPRVSIRF
ncbi:MAG: carboxypeptidase regulatory-like domain-containing protein [Myxococcales bacterium]|nr:carboxypeptidase regulatory-like domain-containing protein [Myxococcales bacterium]